jgi:hypothetical protein
MTENKQSNPEKMSNEEKNTHFQFDVTWKKILAYVPAADCRPCNVEKNTYLSNKYI